MDEAPAAKAKMEVSPASRDRAARAKVLLYWALALFILTPWLILILRSAPHR